MNNFPRRSPRFQAATQNSHPTFSSVPSSSSISSQASSTLSTSHPSPTNNSLNYSSQQQQYPLQIQSQFLAPAQQFNAPLPSPSANDIDPFGQSQYQAYNMGGQAQNQNTNSYQNQNNQSHNFGGPTSQHHHNSFSQPAQRDYPPASVNGVPPGLPADFLAEAAKRAQMACLMRDLGDVAL